MKRMNRIMQLLVLATALQSAQPIFAAADDAADGMMSWFSGFSPASIPGYQTWQNMSTSEKTLTGSIAVLAVLALAGGSYWATQPPKESDAKSAADPSEAELIERFGEDRENWPDGGNMPDRVSQ